jgi:hypothetical protein
MLPFRADVDKLADAADKADVRGASLDPQNRPFIHEVSYGAFGAGQLTVRY